MGNNTYLYTSGVALKKPASTKSAGTITDVDVGVTFDDNGNIIFRDNYVANYLNKESVSLAEIYSRTKAITYRDGKIYFKDASLQREYSLEEIVNTCAQWKRNLIAGSLWWVGRTELDHRSCANIPKTKSTLDRLPVYWSVDKFMADTTGVSICDNIKPLSFYEKTTDPDTGKWKWYDVQNLEIVIPPIEDTYKLAMIIAKLTFTQRKSSEPIVFRLFDATAGVELTRVSVINNGSDYVQHPVPLVYVGQIPIAGFTSINLAKNSPSSIVCSTAEDCGCIDTTCVEGEKNCITPNISYVDKKYAPNSHLIKVQFHVVDFHPDYWDRYFGVDIDNTAAAVSSINTMIFDASPSTTYVHRQGTATFNNVKSVDVVFESELTTNAYSVSLCANKNIQIWYTNKTSKGFTINSELEFQGFVDWTLLNITDK
jgi:hypothetical protein